MMHAILASMHGLLPVSAHAEPTDSALGRKPTVGAIVRPEVVVDLQRDYGDEDGLELHTFGRAFARGETERKDVWFLEARLQHHALFGTDTEGWWDLTVGETGIDTKVSGPVRLKAGALVERWGRLNLLPVSDVLNPREGRSGPFTPAEYQRIPIPMAVVLVQGGAVRSETTLIPFATADRLFLRETDWAYVRQGMVDDYLASVAGWEGGNPLVIKPLLNSARLGLREMPPSLRRGLDAAVNGNSLPESLLYNAEIAQRFEISARNIDIGLVGGYLYSRQAQSNLDPLLVSLVRTEILPGEEDLATLQGALAGGPLDVVWPRTVVGGADASMLAGPIQLRAETLFQSARVVRQSFGRAAVAPNLGVGIGADYVHGGQFQLSLEARWMHLFDPPPQLLFSLEDQIQLAGGVRIALAKERVQVQLGGAYDLSFNEYVARPSVGYRFSDSVLGEVGALLLGGSTPAPTTLQEAFAFKGGPASYWSHNDAVTLAFTFIR